MCERVVSVCERVRERKRAGRERAYLDVVLEDVGGAADGRHVVHDELAVGGQEVAPLVQLLDASLVLTVCNTRTHLTTESL